MPGLCNPANRPSDWVEGAFDIVGDITAGCSPLPVEVVDKSGGTNIRYTFNYTGGGINAFPGTTDILVATDQTKTYTILQYGLKGGKQMVACKQVTVKPGIDFSYTLCNVGYEPGNTFMTGQIGVQVPAQDQIVNHKIQYKIGTNAPIDVLTLPHNTADISVVVPNSISIYAVDATGNKVCERNESILGVQENPFRAELSLLEVIASDKAEITLKGSFSNTKYSLYRIESGADYSSRTKINDFLPGIISADIPDSTKSYCFFAERPTTCGGWESTTDICTIPFDTIEHSATSNTLSWENHTEKIYNTDYPPASNVTRKIESRIELDTDRIPDSPIILNPFTSPYIHHIDCKKDYCYQIVSTIKDRWGAIDYVSESRSLKRCISRKDIKAPPITDLRTSVNGNAVDIDFIDDSGWALNKPYYFLYHSQGGEYKKADSTTAQNPFDYSLQDPNQESLCFKVGYIDQCGSHSALSPEVCTIHLSYDDPDLLWTSESPFSPAAIIGYEIEEVQPLAATIANTLPTEYFHSPDFGDREDEITYRVKASATNGNSSFSNLIKVLPVFGMHFPTAFTPNGDAHNESLVLKGKKGMIKDFSLEVFDRDRNKIYSTTDKDFSWNGHIDDVPLTPGTYLLVVKAALISGEVITQAEKITILH
jgi:gliding motility-associated-like protein